MTVELKEGDLVELVGFHCLENGTIRRINASPDGQLYFFCMHGTHAIDRQVEIDLRLDHCSITKI